MTAAAAAAWLERLGAVAARLEAHAAAEPPAGLTDPDTPSGERWDAGQVWAHLAEFPAYWIGQVRRILDTDPAADPVAFGRTKSDEARIAAIARDRGRPVTDLHHVVGNGVAAVEVLLRAMDDGDWWRRGLHPSLGAMDMNAIMEEFLVGHLEQHARQLDGLGDAGRHNL